MKAMVLCAGFGTRLGSLTAELPKAMLSLGESTIVEHILHRLVKDGFTDVAINLHHRADQLRRHLGDGRRFGLRLSFSEEDQPLGTAGGVKRMARCLLPAGPFLVHYGDIVTGQNLHSLMAFHEQRGGLATLLVHRRRRSNSIVEIDACGIVTRFVERPTDDAFAGDGDTLVFSGLAVLSPELLEYIPDNRPSDLPRDIFPPLVEDRRLAAYPLDGFRVAVDSRERLAEARVAVEGARAAGD